MQEVPLPGFELCRRLRQRQNRPRTHHLFDRLLSRTDELGDRFCEKAAYDRSYLTDLRMQQSREPKLFFDANASTALAGSPDLLREVEGDDDVTARFRRPIDTETNSWSRLQASTSDVALWGQVLCCYVDYMGSWSDAKRIAAGIRAIANSLPGSDDTSWTLGLAGNVFAVAGDPICRELYAQAYDADDDLYQRFFIQLRLATAELKRLRDFPRAAAALEKACSLARELNGTGLSADAQVARALALNLRALYETKAGRPGQAVVKLERAWDLISTVEARDVKVVRRDVLCRYRVTIRQNFGLLASYQSRWSDAVAHFSAAVSDAGSSDIGSAAESLSYLGYARYREKDMRGAHAACSAAEAILRRDAVPERLAQVHKFLAVIAYELGRIGESKAWLKKATIPCATAF